MKHHLILLLASIASLLLATSLSAEVPSLISYQGRLTSVAGTPVPDASYSVVFTIYDAASGGTSKWAETQSVTTSGGFFSVMLGSVVLISDTVFSGMTRYLGIMVGTDPEMNPRVTLVSVPYAHRVKTIDGATGGVISGSVGIGITNPNHTLDVAGDIGATQFRGPLVVNGGNITYAADGGEHIFTAATQERMRITNATGDASIVLPTGAINKNEILDEPGISSDYSSALVNLSPTKQALVSTTIAIPAPGYVLIEGHAQGAIYGPTTNTNGAFFISSPPDYMWTGGQLSFGLSSVPTGYNYFPVSVRSIVYCSTAGSYTYTLVGTGYYGCPGCTGNTVRFMEGYITAYYFPTSYGAVSGLVSESRVNDFENSSVVEVIDPQTGTISMQYLVDLRELELKAAKAETEAERLRRQVVEEKLKQQGESGK